MKEKTYFIWNPRWWNTEAGQGDVVWIIRDSPRPFLHCLWKAVEHAKSVQSCLTLCDPYRLYPTRLLCPWDSPGKNIGVGCRALLQRIFPTHESNPRLTFSALAGRDFTTSTTWKAATSVLFLVTKSQGWSFWAVPSCGFTFLRVFAPKMPSLPLPSKGWWILEYYVKIRALKGHSRISSQGGPFRREGKGNLGIALLFFLLSCINLSSLNEAGKSHGLKKYLVGRPVSPHVYVSLLFSFWKEKLSFE